MVAARRNAKRSRPPAKKASSSSRPAARGKPTPSKSVARPAPKAASKRPAPKASSPPSKKPSPAKPSAAAKPAAAPPPELSVPLPGGRRHVLSLSFLRDGDEFLARMESDGGHITELKNRSLDQLLTLVAGELEDLLT